MLIFLFSVTLGWLPASGYVRLTEDWRASLATTVMPAFVLGNAIAAVLMRHTRSAMLQAMSADYVRTARAKGLFERRVVLKHALRNALTPVITLGALEFGTLLSGAVLTEQIFTIPGFGKLIVDAVFNRDYAVVQGVVLVTATDLHHAQPAGRRGLRSGQSAAARMTASAHPRRRRRRCQRARSPARAPGAGSSAARVPWRAWSSSCCSCWWPSSRRWSRPTIPSPELERGAQGAVGAALAGHRRGRPRRAQLASSSAPAPRSAPGVISVGIALAIGVPLGLLAGYAGGCIDALAVAHRRCHAGGPVPDPGHCAWPRSSAPACPTP